jgi:hypothetical protein
MRLSEAMMLGAATCKMEPGDIRSCAIGAGLNAEGDQSFAIGRYFAASRIWPWLGELKTLRGDRFLVPDMMGRITRRFDDEVCYGEMTLEQLVDYVRSIEPDCDCNRFNCDCKAAAPETAELVEQHA